MTEILNKFGKRLKALREAKGLSQEKLASKSKVHRTYVSLVERGKKNISLVNMEKIAKALNISISEFFKQ